jgi:hypothetical protein
MSVASFVPRLAPAVACGIVVIAGCRLHAQGAEVPEPVRLALVRCADLRALAVTWVQTVEATPIGRAKIAADLLDKILGDGPVVQQMAFCNGRIYSRRETQAETSWPPRTYEVAFDGKLLYTAHNLFYSGNLRNRGPRDRPYLHKWSPQNDAPEASYFPDDYFRAAGIRLPTRIKELASSWHPQAELSALLAEGGRMEAVGPAELEGRRLMRVQAKRQCAAAGPQPSLETKAIQYDFYFDPEWDYTLRRLEIRDGAGRLLTRSDCAEFEQLDGQRLQTPRLCRVEEYAVPRAAEEQGSFLEVCPSPVYIKKIQVHTFDVKPWPDDRFQLKCLAPGAYVNDASFPEIKGKDGVFYQVPADPQRLDEVIALRRALYQGWRSAEKRSRPLRVLFLVLNGASLAGLGVYFLVRQRKKVRST